MLLLKPVETYCSDVTLQRMCLAVKIQLWVCALRTKYACMVVFLPVGFSALCKNMHYSLSLSRLFFNRIGYKVNQTTMSELFFE